MIRLSYICGFLGLFVFSFTSVQSQEQLIESTVSEQNTSGWVANKAETTIVFSGEQSGEAFIGSFADCDVVVNFDPDNLTDASVVVTIDMNSADTDDAESANALPSKEWFNTRKFPVAKFEANDFRYLNDDSYEAKGNLSIKDVTRSIILPFTLKIENGYAVMDAKLKLDRTTYEVGTGMWASKDWVEHNIDVSIHLEAKQNQ